MLSGLFSRLFGGGDPPAPKSDPPEVYKDFQIVAEPIEAGGEFRIAARISKGERSHHLIRADTMRDRDAAAAASVSKARQVIDERGDRLFD
jgi:hypothetical protein